MALSGKIDETGDKILINGIMQMTDGYDEVRQRAYITLQTYLGEWIYNTEFGTEWRQYILGKKYDKDTVTTVVINGLRRVNITNISKLDVTYERKERQLRISFTSIVGEKEVKEVIFISVY